MQTSKAKKQIFKIAMITGAMLLSACGPKLAPQHKSGGRSSIRADQSMRLLVNQKWSCSHSDDPAADVLPYRKFTLFNDGTTQSLQIAVHYSDTRVPTADWVEVENLQCLYSSADVRIVNCVGTRDRTLQVRSTIVYQPDQQRNVLKLDIRGASNSFTVYFGGKENRLATLGEFKARYHDPFEIPLSAVDVCGFVE